jgi:hypothetical protein
MSGSSMKSRSMKKKTGKSTSSPARILCSSKQKHSTLAKYGAIYTSSSAPIHAGGEEVDVRCWESRCKLQSQ